MGLFKEALDQINVALGLTALPIGQIKMCEFGDQILIENEFHTAKEYFVFAGIGEHVSIDINGQNGAEKLDLSLPIAQWKNYFDIVTNCGTIEHIDANQYQAFKNMHNFTKPNGLMYHSLPKVGFWKKHCKYHYKETIIPELAVANDYEILYMGNIKFWQKILITAILRKRRDNEFMSQEQFSKCEGIFHG